MQSSLTWEIPLILVIELRVLYWQFPMSYLIPLHASNEECTQLWFYRDYRTQYLQIYEMM